MSLIQSGLFTMIFLLLLTDRPEFSGSEEESRPTQHLKRSGHGDGLSCWKILPLMTLKKILIVTALV